MGKTTGHIRRAEREIRDDQPYPVPKRAKIPWDKLEVGQSVITGYNAQAACDSRNLNDPPKVFMSAKDADGIYRIWRIG